MIGIMKKVLYFAVCIAALFSCNKADRTGIAESANSGIQATAVDFEGFAPTRTAVSTAGTFAWAEGDVIGVVPADDRTMQTNFEIVDLGSNPKSALFDGGAWQLKEGKSYLAYFPYRGRYLTSSGKVEFSFAGQQQIGNDNADNIGAYDYMYASAVSTADGCATFAFRHLVSLVKLTVPAPKAASYSRLAISSSVSDGFASKATLNLADGSLVAGASAASIELGLEDVSLSADGDLVAYVMVLPTSKLDGQILKAVLTDTEGSTYEFVATSAAKTMEAGKAYSIGFARESVFEDDFSWLAPFIAAYNAANATPIGDTVGDKDINANAPNAYTTAPFNTTEFAEAFASHGYTDLNPDEKLIYPQDQYLKFSRTGGHNTALQLSLANYVTGTMDLVVMFDYAMMVQGSGTVDSGPIVVMIDGDGKFANGTKRSSQFTSAQKTGEFLWNSASDTITGASANTKLIFINGRVSNAVGTYNWSVSGAGRFFLDNIKIVEK